MNHIQKAKSKLATIIFACLSATSCGAQKEVPISLAKPGDTISIVGDQRIVLVSEFKAGQPNGLFDGGVQVIDKNKNTRFVEVNVVCSMPDLPGWPDYDNIYGRWLEVDEKPGEEGGATQWQLLMHFNGKHVNKGNEEAPNWAQRVALNACRKGKFRDN